MESADEDEHPGSSHREDAPRLRARLATGRANTTSERLRERRYGQYRRPGFARYREE